MIGYNSTVLFFRDSVWTCQSNLLVTGDSTAHTQSNSSTPQISQLSCSQLLYQIFTLFHRYVKHNLIVNVTYLLYVNHQVDQLDRKTSILLPLKAFSNNRKS